MPRKIAVFTGTRAEYGLLFWTLRELQARGLEPQLIVTGTHLSPAHGHTVTQIEADGFTIAARVDMALGEDSPLETALAMGRGLSGMAEALAALKPDIAVILGDRYEMLAAAAAASMLGVPIAHIHGGEVTEGALDEALRHAITKLSYWHFATAEPYAARIVQLGEDPARVFTSGAPGLDNIARLPLLSRAALAEALEMKLDAPFLLLTYHPETLSPLPPEMQIRRVLEGLEAFADMPLLITGANADPGGNVINTALQAYANSRPQTRFFASLGSLRYLSAMRLAAALVGNSSSAVIEAPALGRPAVNIGDRQHGRLRAPHVVDCLLEVHAISQAISKALSDIYQSLPPSRALGEPGQAAPIIAEKLAHLPLPKTPRKAFWDKP